MDNAERKVARLGSQFEARLKTLISEFNADIRREVAAAKPGALAALALVAIEAALRQVYGEAEMEAAHVTFEKWARDERHGGLGRGPRPSQATRQRRHGY